MKILLVGLTNKAGLAVARNLNKIGCEVDAIYIKDVAARFSKHVHASFYFGDPEQDVASFLTSLLGHIGKNKYDGLIPLHDAALEICRRHQSEIGKHVKIAGINDDSSYKYSIDKHEMLEIGRAHGLLTPESHLIDSMEAFLRLDQRLLKFPLVAKPVSSAVIKGNRVLGYSVKVCHNIGELTDFVRENVHSVRILVQEFVKGYGIGYDFISKDGRIQNEYIHRRVNENNGVSTLRASLTTEAYGLKEKVTATVKAMNWSGVGMIEFMVKPDGTAVLMEFNGRFFGSTELSTRSGINLPVLFYQQFVLEQQIPENLPVKKSSVRFFQDELILFTAMLFQGKPGQFLKWALDIVVSLFKPRHYFETTLFSDFSFSRAFYAYEYKRLSDKRKRKKALRNVQVRAITKEDLQQAKHITFFCLGNICRSPFAMYMAQATNAKQTFDSLGSIAKEDRMSPVNAVVAAREFGVDMEPHRSRCIAPHHFPDTDLFVVMDRNNYFDLVSMGVPEAKIRFLASEEIADPYGKSVEEFKLTYSKVQAEIKRLFNN